MGTSLLCTLALFLLLSLCCSTGSLQPPSTIPTTTAVEPPFNLIMESYNFNTTLYWDYKHTSGTPRFTVQIRHYLNGKAIPVETCRNIPEHFCDVSQHVKSLDDYYWGQVKVKVGDEESDFAESSLFNLREQGKIGPPTLDVSMDQEKVFIEVFHPVTYFKKNQTLLDFFEDFNYIVYLGNKELEFEDDDCDYEACSMSVPPPEKDVVLCVSAKGISKSWDLSSEKSKEACLNIQDNESVKVHRYHSSMIVGFSIFAVLLFVLSVVLVNKTLQRKNIKLPKSLAFLALNRGANFSGEDPVPEDVSPLSVTNEKQHLLNQQPKSEIIDESPVQVATDGSETSLENCSLPVTDGIKEIPGQYAAPNSSTNSLGKENYLTSGTSAAETGSVAASSESMHTLGERTDCIPPPATVRESFGYDKPHAPLSLAIQAVESASYPE